MSRHIRSYSWTRASWSCAHVIAHMAWSARVRCMRISSRVCGTEVSACAHAHTRRYLAGTYSDLFAHLNTQTQFTGALRTVNSTSFDKSLTKRCRNLGSWASVETRMHKHTYSCTHTRARRHIRRPVCTHKRTHENIYRMLLYLAYLQENDKVRIFKRW